MRIAVLGSLESWYVQDLRRAAPEHNVSAVTFRQMQAVVGKSGTQVRSGEIHLNKTDAILIRTMPPGSLEQVVFRMDVLGQLAADQVVLNSPRAIETSVDKYLTTARLQEAGLLVPQTFACQTADDAMTAYSSLGGIAVCKPLFGSEGRGIFRLDDEAAALRAFKMLEQLGAVIYLQQFIHHDGADLRLLVVGEEIYGMRRVQIDDWRTNASRGAQCEPLNVTDELAQLARRAAVAVGAEIAGIDLLPDRDGRLYAIEVNAVPGWRALSRTTGVDIAARVIRYLEHRVEATA